jgi:hypothetical protein
MLVMPKGRLFGYQVRAAVAVSSVSLLMSS